MTGPVVVTTASWLILMRAALREVAIERRGARLRAYARANVPREVADALDDDAHLAETLRRGRTIAAEIARRAGVRRRLETRLF